MNTKKLKLINIPKKEIKNTNKTNSKKHRKKQVYLKVLENKKKRIQIGGDTFKPYHFVKKIEKDNIIEGRPTPLNTLLLQYLFNNNKVEINDKKQFIFSKKNVVLVKKKGIPKEFRNPKKTFSYITEEPLKVKTDVYTNPQNKPLNYPEHFKNGKFYVKAKNKDNKTIFVYQNVEYVNDLIKQLQQPIDNNKDLNTVDFTGDLQYKDKNIFYGLLNLIKNLK